ncbi:MAG: hypothetical protein GX112_08535 [Clostridiaceae bacterium]|jgi:hypothetical protein|nr:hypothetical protein [Clostridiaceae bacterium]
MFRLENEYLMADFDAMARLIRLENKACGRNVIARPASDSFRLVARIGDNWEQVVFAHEQAFELTGDDTHLTAIVRQVATRDAVRPLEIRLEIRLEGRELLFASSLANRSDDLLVTDWTYPVIGQIASLAGSSPDLLWPNHLGERYPEVTRTPGDWHLTYPGGHGRGASMQWMALTEEDQTLALSGRDQAIYSSELSARTRPEGLVTLEMTKLPFARPDETWTCPPYLLSLYTGSWHETARQYRDWAASWRRTPAPPEWVRQMSGYFLVINKQQYGEEFWPYDTLPELYGYARANGCDTVGLFGWYHGGHDNTYPEIQVSPTLGGAKALRDGIRQVREQGGHVTLYIQGHLLDLTTDFYKKRGHKLESKTRWQTPYYQTHCKSHNSRFLANYTAKFFASACPSCPEWHDEMAGKAEELAVLGPSGFLYDQIGGMHPYPCFDESHPHPQNRPSLAFVPGRVKLLERIQQTTKRLDPEMAFLTEHITDVYSGWADLLHGMYVNPNPPGGGHNYPELFRYTFPETFVTIRNGKPYISERYLNFAFVYGLRLEMELRYLDDQDAIRSDRHPRERQLAAAMTDFRKRYWHLFGSGRFVDTDGFATDNPAVAAKAFADGGQIGVALWNDTEHDQAVQVAVPGCAWQETARPDGQNEDNAKPGHVLLKSQQVALLLFAGKKEE